MRCLIALLPELSKNEGSFDCVDRVKKSWSFLHSAFTIHNDRISLKVRTPDFPLHVFLQFIEQSNHYFIKPSRSAFSSRFTTSIHNNSFFSSITHCIKPLPSISISATAHAHIKILILVVASLLSISKPLIQPRLNTNRRTHRPAQTSDRKTPIQCATIRTFSCHIPYFH